MKLVNVGPATGRPKSTPSPTALSPLVPEFFSETLELSAGTASDSTKRAYPPPCELPTQEGPKGIRFDFNDGCRVALPEGEQPWRVCPQRSRYRQYTVRDRAQIGAGDQQQTLLCALSDRGVAAGREHLKSRLFSRGPRRADPAPGRHARRSARLVSLCGEVHGASRLPAEVCHRRKAHSIASRTFLTEDDVDPERYYATYTIAVFFQSGAIYDRKDFVPCDFRLVGLHRAAGYILGVDPAEVPSRIAIADDRKPPEQPYVCIAVQSMLQSKYWNNPTRWGEIVGFLKQAGCRVVCIDQKRTRQRAGLDPIPNGAEDETGDRPLVERARWLKHAEFFIGLSSGLSWFAWAVGTPVVMISGLTHPRTEFATPFRVINYHVCNSCWNDPLARYMRDDFLTCPRHKDTPRQFECTRLITAEQVKAVIRTIPGFGTST